MLLHDIGYIWVGTWQRGDLYKHAIVSGRIISFLLGRKYGVWCMRHSRKACAHMNVRPSLACHFDKKARCYHSKVGFGLMVLLDVGFWTSGVHPLAFGQVSRLYQSMVIDTGDDLPVRKPVTIY